MAIPAMPAATKAAAAVLADEKVRTAVLSVLVGVIAAILLPIVLLFSLLLLPFSSLGTLAGKRMSGWSPLLTRLGKQQIKQPPEAISSGGCAFRSNPTAR